ncbi:glycine oxidase ThiO [Tuberibacillus sp. Marseille-P3662]|uniref:glycine oxidase ThiO n=1 Tax=Tuberibacillus sp. Marseille-P3662 TaxID=1965358 RepID=UPI000A1CA7CE|nr:glycine oxidase ThiO [Tuberibacillus sp. Marseille-P3662]
MVKKYDVLIVGGGVIGCAAAFYSAKAGQRVLLVEKDKIGSRTSQAAAGMLGVQTELDGPSPLYDLAKRSRSMFSELSEELRQLTGIDIVYRQSGAMRPAFSEQDMARMETIADWQRRQGETAQCLTRSEVLATEPALSDTISGALYFPYEGQVEPTDLTQALARAAVHYGAKLEEHNDVLEVMEESEKVTGVRTLKGDYAADHVIVTAGVWSGKTDLTHADIDLFPIKGEALSVRVAEPMLSRTIFSESCYITPKQGDKVYIGATEKPYDYDTDVTVDGVYQLLSSARALLPALSQAKIDQIWAGLRPTTRDRRPYIGQAPHTENLWYGFGHHRNGILLSPVTGWLLAQLVQGRQPDIDLTPFSHSQYSSKEVLK